MMDLPKPSEEERRLLREFRITKVPTRRKTNGHLQQPGSHSSSQSSSSASSYSSSGSSTPSINPLSFVVERQPPTQNQKSGCQSSPKQPQQIKQTHSQLPKSTPDKQLQVPLQKSKSQSPQMHSHSQGRQINNHNHNNHHHHHHHHQNGHKHQSNQTANHAQRHHHHHHHHHRRKHKSATPTHELTAEELSKMLDLASGLSYLRLVCPIRTTTSNGTQSVKLSPVKTATTTTTTISTNTASKKSCNNKNLTKANNGTSNIACAGLEKFDLDSESAKNYETNNNNNNNNTSDNSGSNNTSNQSTFTRNLNINCNNNLSKLLDGFVEKPYIFEKVDYIKKISIRRKALKRLKKTKNKSCSVSPPATTNSSTATEG